MKKFMKWTLRMVAMAVVGIAGTVLYGAHQMAKEEMAKERREGNTAKAPSA